MKPIFIFLIIILAANEINCEKNDQNLAKNTFKKQRRIGFYQKYRLNELLNKFSKMFKIVKLYQNLMKFIENTRPQITNEEHEKKKQIFEKFLLQHQNGSSFLRDFHTRRL